MMAHPLLRETALRRAVASLVIVLLATACASCSSTTSPGASVAMTTIEPPVDRAAATLGVVNSLRATLTGLPPGYRITFERPPGTAVDVGRQTDTPCGDGDFGPGRPVATSVTYFVLLPADVSAVQGLDAMQARWDALGWEPTRDDRSGDVVQYLTAQTPDGYGLLTVSSARNTLSVRASSPCFAQTAEPFDQLAPSEIDRP